ncbi:hypothetical protein ORIO_04235 [Cereibacter azotoformans]|uniref:hypothetical protein n=1 Tax=Cereibacter azotoformans TaxID=43057 RepID=UPI001EEB569B|nr:hypothetical protein [Cereibacter azotoformans]ULB09136.1 hypothetical protein ORIO_04235 [Cereibacter azotoformans]
MPNRTTPVPGVGHGTEAAIERARSGGSPHQSSGHFIEPARIGEPDLVRWLRDAMQATPFVERDRGPGQDPQIIPKLAASGGDLDLRAAVRRPVVKEGRVTAVPVTVHQAGETVTLGDVARAGSRALAAGAHLIPMVAPKPIDPARSGGVVAFELVPASLRLVEPAPFSVVAPDGEADEAALSAISAEAVMDRESLTQRCFRIRIPRQRLQEIGWDAVADEVMTALGLGLGRAVDAELFAALEAAELAPWSVGRAAAAGVRFDELRAVVGTAGYGAAIEAGRLCARWSSDPSTGGIAAELSPDLQKTLVAAWSRFAVAVSPEVRVLIERRSAVAVVMTCWLDCQALIPDERFAWTMPEVLI